MQMSTDLNDSNEAQLWKMARKRASFKRHLFTYLVVNAFLWMLWLIMPKAGFPWAVWPTFGWGIAITFNYFSVYHSEGYLAREEFAKLKRERPSPNPYQHSTQNKPFEQNQPIVQSQPPVQDQTSL